jgi:hypothetical protein
MKRFIRTLLFVLTIPLSVAAVAQNTSTAEVRSTVAVGSPSDTVDVQHVIDSYHEAVLAHDGSRLSSLFLPQGSMWLNVLSDDAFAQVKAKSPKATKVHIGSYTDFAKMVSNPKVSLNPTHAPAAE